MNKYAIRRCIAVLLALSFLGVGMTAFAEDKPKDKEGAGEVKKEKAAKPEKKAAKKTDKKKAEQEDEEEGAEE